jgi:F-type H+-transporting ATPase subunit a
MLIAKAELLEHVLDHPWPGCRVEPFGIPITWMSGGILSILIVGAVLLVVLPLMARRCGYVPSGGQSFLEVIVVFVRDMIARPALHEKAYDYLPFLTTVFVYVFALNLIGLVPFQSISLLAGIERIGGTPTAIPTVGAALASLALLAIVFSGLRRAARHFHERRRWPMALCVALSPALWFVSLAPPVPGLVGQVILIPMALLELVSALAKCVALMVRLCANMVAGHMLLGVLMWLAIEAVKSMVQPVPQATYHAIYVVPVCVVGSAVLNLMELLVCGIQAFIFTIMTSLFLGMYAETDH